MKDAVHVHTLQVKNLSQGKVFFYTVTKEASEVAVI